LPPDMRRGLRPAAGFHLFIWGYAPGDDAKHRVDAVIDKPKAYRTFEMKRITVVGAGNWGTALAVMAARKGHEVRLWSRNSSVVNSVCATRVNATYLPDCVIPDKVQATTEIIHALNNAELVILAAPSHGTRELLQQMAAHLHDDMVLVSATKGIEIETGKRISQVVEDVLEPTWRERFVCLSGPSFANEVVAGHPTAIVAAGSNAKARALVQSELSFDNLRIYANDDVI